MKMLAEYVEHAIQFEHLAADEGDPGVRARLLDQAKAYRKLAEERAARLKVTLPLPKKSNRDRTHVPSVPAPKSLTARMVGDHHTSRPAASSAFQRSTTRRASATAASK
jgi:hypothetical protein